MSKFLDYAAKKYYEGTPVISDKEFDKMAEGTNYVNVGYSDGDIDHTYRMYSLQKKVVGDNIDSVLEGDIVWTPKLDGAAVSLSYVSGNLLLALTRGDGIKGKDITEKMKHLVPNRLHSRRDEVYSGRLVQITGEVVANKEIPNARNYAAGSLNLKDIEEFKIFFMEAEEIWYREWCRMGCKEQGTCCGGTGITIRYRGPRKRAWVDRTVIHSPPCQGNVSAYECVGPAMEYLKACRIEAEYYEGWMD